MDGVLGAGEWLGQKQSISPMKSKPLFTLVSSLSGVTRFSMLKMCHRETVLEHTGMMVCFCFALGSRINQYSGFQLDMGKLLTKATVHDWDEAITGDVARPTKYFSSTLRNEMAALEKEGVSDISEALEIKTLSALHADAKEEPEGQIVKLCDIACAIHRCWEEVLVFNNMHFTLPAHRLRRVLHKTMRELSLDELNREQRNEIDYFVLDLNGVLNDVLQSTNGHLMEIARAN